MSISDGKVEVLATGLEGPKGVAISADGTCYVAEANAGRIVKIEGGSSKTVVDGMGVPNGIVISGDKLFAIDSGNKELVEHNLVTGKRQVLAAGLPVGDPPGITPKPIGPIGTMSGPMGLFAGICAGKDGTLYFSGDAEGSVMALRPG